MRLYAPGAYDAGRDVAAVAHHSCSDPRIDQLLPSKKSALRLSSQDAPRSRCADATLGGGIIYLIHSHDSDDKRPSGISNRPVRARGSLQVWRALRPFLCIDFDTSVKSNVAAC